MFRPEMLEAMGLPKDVRVHGWGLSLERCVLFVFTKFRPTMIMTGCSNIRELLGHKCSIEWIETQPAVRLGG
jgi:phenylalanyl-tRNA synthetase alpha chain